MQHKFRKQFNSQLGMKAIYMAILIYHLDHIRKFNREVVFSDGAPTEFQQKFTICGMILLQHSLNQNLFTKFHGKRSINRIGVRIKHDVYSTLLSKGLNTKNLVEYVDIAEHCFENITILKCFRKHILSIVKQVDKDTTE